MPERGRFATSIGASALLHLIVLGALFAAAVGPKPNLRLPSIEVDLDSISLAAKPAPPAAAPAPAPAPAAPPPDALPEPRRQIVQPSDAGEEIAPQDTRLLSDRDNTVAEEIVRRGDGGTDPDSRDRRLSEAKAPKEKPAPAPPAPRAPAPPKPAPAPRAVPPRAAAPARPAPGDLAGERLAALPSLDKLLPRAEDIARSQPLPEATVARERSGRDLLNSGGQVFSGAPGTRDLLPRVREGNITMLNTKADLFAPFVRRVAGRVFENLDMSLTGLRNSRNPGRGRTVAWVEAVMDRRGRFVRAELKEQQGLSIVSRLLLDAAQPDTFFDANPPSGAEAGDGLIHFRLMIDLVVDAAVDPRTGRAFTTYYGVAGVGLL